MVSKRYVGKVRRGRGTTPPRPSSWRSRAGASLRDLFVKHREDLRGETPSGRRIRSAAKTAARLGGSVVGLGLAVGAIFAEVFVLGSIAVWVLVNWDAIDAHRVLWSVVGLGVAVLAFLAAKVIHKLLWRLAFPDFVMYSDDPVLDVNTQGRVYWVWPMREGSDGAWIVGLKRSLRDPMIRVVVPEEPIFRPYHIAVKGRSLIPLPREGPFRVYVVTDLRWATIPQDPDKMRSLVMHRYEDLGEMVKRAVYCNPMVQLTNVINNTMQMEPDRGDLDVEEKPAV